MAGHPVPPPPPRAYWQAELFFYFCVFPNAWTSCLFVILLGYSLLFSFFYFYLLERLALLNIHVKTNQKYRCLNIQSIFRNRANLFDIIWQFPPVIQCTCKKTAVKSYETGCIINSNLLILQDYLLKYICMF